MRTTTRNGRTPVWSALGAILTLLLLALAPASATNHAGPPSDANVSNTGIYGPPAPPMASRELLGLSGRLRAVMGTPQTLDEDPVLRTVHPAAAHWPKIPTSEGESLTVVPLVPLQDADGNDRMDDLDGDGKITVGDARVLLAVAERVEADHPNLVGGLSAYPANSAHGPFVHVDARGVKARW